MQIHEVKRNTKRAKKMKIGRGGKRGKTSGKGMKGQNARSGTGGRPEIRDMIKKIPKLRGRGVNMNKSHENPNAAVNLGDLDIKFKDGDIVSPLVLHKAGLIKKIAGKFPTVKILSKGELSKKLTIKNCLFSKTAEEAIKKAGGEIK